MRTYRAIAVLLLVAVLAGGCDTSTPTATPTPPVPATVPVVVTQLPPTATPTPIPARAEIDLGVPAGDAYNVAGGILDAQRGLLYAVANAGDASGSGVLSVVDIASRQVITSVALPVTPGWPASAALSADGSRLYVAGTTREHSELVVAVATGAGNRPVGEVLGTVLEARALALDAQGGHLYVASQRLLRMLDAFTLKEREIVNLRADMPPTVLLAVNPQSNRVYVCGSGDNIINTFRTDDLTPAADIEPGAQVYGLFADPNGPYTAATVQAFTRLQTVSRAALVEGDRILRQWDAGENYTVGRAAWHEGRILLLEDGSRDGKQVSRIRIANPATGEIARTLDLPYLNLQYAAVAAPYQGSLQRLGETLYPVDLDTGEIGDSLPLGLNLMGLALDEAGGRLFALDSAGSVHVVQVPAMTRVGVWPVMDAGRDRSYWGQMSFDGERLFVADHTRDVTVVLDSATGSKIGEIPKAGLVSADPAGHRLFVTNQGVSIADATTYQVIGSVAGTVRDPSVMYSPGATEAVYDPGSGLLFVTMTNNGTGSGSRTWLDVYDGKTLALAGSPIQSDQRFVDGLIVDAQAGRVWVASNYPRASLSAWSLDGRLLMRSVGLGGRLYLDAARKRLYVRAWGGLAAVDAGSGDPVGFQSLDVQYPDAAVLDAPNSKFYITSGNSATVRAMDAGAPPVSAESPGALPAQPVRQIVTGAEAPALVVSNLDDSGGVGLFRSEAGGWVRVRGSVPDRTLLRVVATGKPDTFFAYSAESYSPLGPFRTTDGGRTWSTSARGLNDFYIRDLVVSPHFAMDGTALLASETGIFRTTDGGGTWQKFSDISATRIAAAFRPSFMALGSGEDYATTIVYLADGQDAALEQVGVIPLMPYFVKALALSPMFAEDRTAFVATENAGILRTTDGGRTWNPVGPSIGSYIPQFSFLFSADYSTSRTVYAFMSESLYGGVEERRLFRSTDGGANWERDWNLPAEIVCAAIGADGQIWTGTTAGRVDPLSVSRLNWESAPAPTPTPTPLPPPTPAPTPTPMVFLQPPQGLYWPDGIFTQVWKSNESLRQSLGWAVDAQVHETAAAMQAFETGTMIWRQDAGEVYVLFPPGDWYAITDTWAEGQPESDPSIVPPEGRLQPVRGFGKVWRNEGWVRERVGWAVEPERGFTAQAQRFEHGWMLRMEGSIYAFVNADIGPAYWQRHEAVQ